MLISCDSGALAALQSKPRMGNTLKYVPSEAFSCQRHYCTTLTRKLVVALMLSCDKAASTAANELSQQWVVRQSTTHRLEIRRALYLLPSDKKLVLSCDSGALAALQSKPRMGNTLKYVPSEAFSCQRHYCTTLTRKMVVTLM